MLSLKVLLQRNQTWNGQWPSITVITKTRLIHIAWFSHSIKDILQLSSNFLGFHWSFTGLLEFVMCTFVIRHKMPQYSRMNREEITFGIEDEISGKVKVKHCSTMHATNDRPIMTRPDPDLSNLVPTAKDKFRFLTFKYTNIHNAVTALTGV